MKTGFLTRNVRPPFDRCWLPKVLLASPFVFAAAFGAPAASAQIAKGTVMASISGGKVAEYSQTGTLLATLDTTKGGFTTGSAFDSAGNFYVTDFSANQVTKFDPTGVLIGPFGSGFTGTPESILHDKAGNFYVGETSGNVLKLSATGTLLATISAIGRADWIDLGADQCTLFITAEGVDVMRFNVCTNTALSKFNVAPLPRTAFALRLLSSGGMLIADSSAVIRLDASGNKIQTYTFGAGGLFSLNLDPDGTSFWAGDFTTSIAFKVNIATGTVLTSFPTTGVGNTLFGLSVKGEITAGGGGGGGGGGICGNRVCRF